MMREEKREKGGRLIVSVCVRMLLGAMEFMSSSVMKQTVELTYLNEGSDQPKWTYQLVTPEIMNPLVGFLLIDNIDDSVEATLNHYFFFPSNV